MIKYNLICDNEHEFESWFSDSNEFDNLKKRRLLECIYCSSNNINKSIMAPMVSNSKYNNEQIQLETKSLKDEKLINIYEIFEKPMIKILALMEIEGIKIDNKFLKILSTKFEKKIEKIQKEVFKISKKEFNIASPKQLGEILYNDLKIADTKKNQKGSFATSASVLEDLAFKGHKFPQLVLDWRQISKLKILIQILYLNILILNQKEFIPLFTCSYNNRKISI